MKRTKLLPAICVLTALMLLLSGETISPEQQAHIFEKFYRADEARQGSTGGAGLGLAIASNIVALHGGTITVESKERRTTFTIILPDSEILN